MAVKLRQPGPQATAVITTVAVLSCVLAAPVLAAPERGLLCEAATRPDHTVSTTELTATPVSSSDEALEGHLLKPRTKAAVRGVFSGRMPADQNESDGTEDLEANEAVVAEPRLPGPPEHKRPVYKRQMYRRDI
jgi:hypothetical protein